MVTLRPAKWYHFCSFKNVRWMNDPAVTEFLALRSRYTLRKGWQYWRAHTAASDIMFAIYDDSHHVGNCGFFDYHDGQAQLRISIGDKSVWGKGVGQQTMQLMIAYAKEQHWRQIQLYVNPNNARAVRLYTKLGFQNQGYATIPNAERQFNMILPL